MPTLPVVGVCFKMLILEFSNHAQYGFREFHGFSQKCGVKSEIYTKILSICLRVKPMVSIKIWTGVVKVSIKLFSLKLKFLRSMGVKETFATSASSVLSLKEK